MFIAPEEIKPALRLSRAEIIKNIDREGFFDVLVIGGGIHGAAMARLAAFNGLKTVLLERDDYASATSSRSSKLAHGGLRYLAMYDFRQVFESVKAREDLYQVAAHLVRPYPFLIPIEKEQWFKRLQFSVALPLYEFFTSIKERKHQWLAADDTLVRQSFGSHADSLRGCYRYFDGVMSDTRLVIETILAARQEGADCLNYARVDSVNQRIGNQVEVGWTDMRSDAKYHLRAGVVINCAGPWAPSVGRLAPLAGKVRYSRGSHLLFNKKWELPALFLPLEGKNRYYFVLPHAAGTLVGTTEREHHGELSLDPLPEKDEVEEILSNLRRDIPEHGLDRSSLSYGFAGIRTLAMREGSGETSTISRRHVWDFQGGVLTLYGGKYTSAYWTALEGLKIVQQTAAKGFSLTGLEGRKLPGAFSQEGSLAELVQGLTSEEQSEAAHHAHRLFGGRVREFLESDKDRTLVAQRVLHGSLRLALEFEQVETIEDLMRRRLELEYFSDHGLSALPGIAQILTEIRPATDWAAQQSQYRNRLNLLHERLGIP